MPCICVNKISDLTQIMYLVGEMTAQSHVLRNIEMEMQVLLEFREHKEFVRRPVGEEQCSHKKQW